MEGKIMLLFWQAGSLEFSMGGGGIFWTRKP